MASFDLRPYLSRYLGPSWGDTWMSSWGQPGATSLRAARLEHAAASRGAGQYRGRGRHTRGLPMQTTMGDIVGVFCEVGVEKIKRRAELESRARCCPSCPLAEVYLTLTPDTHTHEGSPQSALRRNILGGLRILFSTSPARAHHVDSRRPHPLSARIVGFGFCPAGVVVGRTRHDVASVHSLLSTMLVYFCRHGQTE